MPQATATTAAEALKYEAQLDATVWLPEVEAQRHEAVLITFRDALRGAPNPLTQLGTMPFGSLELPTFGPAKAGPLNQTERPQIGRGGRLAPAAFRTLLATLGSFGWQLQQTEWQHLRFTPATASSPARSQIRAEAQLLQGAARVSLTGTLHIEWAPGSPPTITSIAVRNAVLRRREGPGFSPLQILPMGLDKATPLLVRDFNGDGKLEIVMPWRNRRFVLRNGRYQPEVFAPNLWPDATAATVADITNDGHDDLILGTATPAGRHVVALIEGDALGRFNGTPKVLFNPKVPLNRVRVLLPGDIDGDGDLDLWVAQYRGDYDKGVMPAPFDDAKNGWPAYLLRNDGGTFVDITEDSGLADHRSRHTQSASFVDLDRDGDLDLLTVNDFAGVELWTNDGAGHFERAPGWIDSPELFGKAHTLADLNADGRLDLFAVGSSSTTAERLESLQLQRPGDPDFRARRRKMSFGNRAYLWQEGRFKLAPWAGQIARSGRGRGVAALDVNNAGQLGLLVTNGFVSGSTAADYDSQYWRHDVYYANHMPRREGRTLLHRMSDSLKAGHSWHGFEHNRLYLPSGAGFVEAAHLLGLGSVADGRNVLAADLNGDGGQDLIIAEAPARGGLEVRLMRNDLPARGHWLGVRLRGRPGLSPQGAEITVETKTGLQTALVGAGRSFLVQGPDAVHFGLGTNDAIRQLTVRWPGGRLTQVETLAIDAWTTIEAPH